MRIRRAPVEHTPPSEFRPRFCPSARCDDHRLDRSQRYRYVRNGFYRRQCDRRRIQRFKCKRCKTGFSQQTFSVTYCMKRPDLLLPVANWIVSGVILRRLARSLNGLRPDHPCHPSTVARLSRRIGSQCLLVHEELRRDLRPITEAIVTDHFETFAGMQENALSVATPVGARSWFVYALEPAWHRQTTAAARRRPRVAPSPGSIARSVVRVLDTLLDKVPDGEVLHLISDQEPNHRWAVARHRQRHRIRYRAYRNPPHRRVDQPRDADTIERDMAMFPVDLLHTLSRTWLSDHHRQTIAFAKRGEAVLERLAMLAVFRNLVQRSSERRDDRVTPAMRLGLTDRPWAWRDVLAERRFPTRTRIGMSAARVYSRTMRDPRGIHWPPHVRVRAL